MLLPGRIYIALGPWHFGDFRYIFLPNIVEDQKNLTISDRSRDGNRSGRPAGWVAGRVEILRPAGQAG